MLATYPESFSQALKFGDGDGPNLCRVKKFHFYWSDSFPRV